MESLLVSTAAGLSEMPSSAASPSSVASSGTGGAPTGGGPPGGDGDGTVQHKQEPKAEDENYSGDFSNNHLHGAPVRAPPLPPHPQHPGEPDLAGGKMLQRHPPPPPVVDMTHQQQQPQQHQQQHQQHQHQHPHQHMQQPTPQPPPHFQQQPLHFAQQHLQPPYNGAMRIQGLVHGHGAGSVASSTSTSSNLSANAMMAAHHRRHGREQQMLIREDLVEGEDDEDGLLDPSDLMEQALSDKVKGLGTFYILIDKHSRKRKRGFTGLRRSQKAAIVR